MQWLIRTVSAVVFFALGSAWASSASVSAEPGTRPPTPVLLELFTSEGCSSCPPADKLLAQLDAQQPVTGADLIALSEHVDYWDDAGWKDPYSSAQFSERQRTYTDKLHIDGPYTPQLVVDGSAQVVGNNAPQVLSTIRKAALQPKIYVALSSVARLGSDIQAHVSLDSAELKGKGGTADLYMAVAASQAESRVSRGENAGRSLSHVAVVLVLFFLFFFLLGVFFL